MLTQKQIKAIEELTGYEYRHGYNHNELGTFEQWFIKAKNPKGSMFGYITNEIFYNEKDNNFIVTKVARNQNTFRSWSEQIEPLKKWIAPLAKILEDSNVL